MNIRRFPTNKSWGYDIYVGRVYIGNIERLKFGRWVNSTDDKEYPTKKTAAEALCELEIENLNRTIRQSKGKIKEIEREMKGE